MKKFKQFMINNNSIIIDILYYIYFIISICVKVFYLQFTTGLSINSSYYHDINVNAIRAAMCIVLIIFSLFFLIFKKKRNGALFVVNIILSVLFLADTLYFRYYQLPLSVSLLYQLKLISDIGGSTGSLFKIKDIIFFIDLPVYIIFALTKRKFKKNYPVKVIKRRYAFVASIIIFAAASLMFNNIYKNVNVSLHAYDRNYAAKDLSILYYHYYDFKTFMDDEIQRKKAVTDEEKETVTSYFKNKNNEKIKNPLYNGIAKDRNLIIVQVEALQNFVIEKTINDQEITPFLNAMINDKDTIYMDNIYHQVAGGNTADAEFLVNNSLYPVGSGAVYFRYPNNLYNSLPKAMIKNGYKTYAAHAYKPSFWNRQKFYSNVGFETFYHLYSYDLDEIIGWAVSDESFFRQTLNKINIDDKFYSFNVTLSSHHPYDAFIGMDNLDVGEYQGKQVGNYLKGARYDDYALEKLFDMLKEKGLYDNSVIVIYGDHSAIFEDQASDLTKFLDIEYNDYNWKKIQQIPVFIHVPDSDINQRISNIGGQIDILPTVSNLLGIDMPYALGKDMLNLPNGEGYAVLRYSSVMTDKYMYLNETSTVYDMETGKELNKDEYINDIRKKLIDLKVSDIIINKDYFRKINK
ncbi:LTA synthase family protein [Sedimentibacter sp. zth1]|uniref:LTA synthase family protein n=1 Tax=Sedimentibacter sp. zth1 TaxID=2816908 RepID=UPI001A914D36|nr:LTA synthase family protein [Sedimentibacter sp. zth1]QSX06125.1 LTA synthase family protein [Sedimentibacter sp. zth1]